MNTFLLIWFGCGAVGALHDVIKMFFYEKMRTWGTLLSTVPTLIAGPIGLALGVMYYIDKYENTPLFKKKDNKDEHEDESVG